RCRDDRALDRRRLVPRLPVRKAAAAPRGRAARDRPGRAADRGEPPARAAHGRRGSGAGAHPADRRARRHPVGGAREVGPDQLHQEVLMTLHLSEDDVVALLSPADAVEAIEACFRRMANGSVENRPRYRLGLEEGTLAVMAASDLELGVAGSKTYAAFSSGVRHAVLLFRADRPELAAVIDADKLGRLRTGAASGVAAKHLARSGATTLGIIGCGRQADSQVECIRAAVPAIAQVVAFCRTPESLHEF